MDKFEQLKKWLEINYSKTYLAYSEIKDKYECFNLSTHLVHKLETYGEVLDKMLEMEE